MEELSKVRRTTYVTLGKDATRDEFGAACSVRGAVSIMRFGHDDVANSVAGAILYCLCSGAQLSTAIGFWMR